jgi:hypothetical protein
MSNPLNSNNKPPVSNGNPSHPDAQGSIRNPFAPSNLPASQHPALRGGVAGNTPIHSPISPNPQPGAPRRG